MVLPGRFCWTDLACTDATRAAAFYASLFGWSARAEPAHGGTFMRLAREGRDVGSLYQLGADAMARGAASHWTPYVRVDDVEQATREVMLLGGSVLVSPLPVPGLARIALAVDPTGAAFGLWERAGVRA